MKINRELEKKYNLTPAIKKEYQTAMKLTEYNIHKSINITKVAKEKLGEEITAELLNQMVTKLLLPPPIKIAKDVVENTIKFGFRY